MGVLESRLVIKATDETAKAFSEVEARIKALEKAALEVEKVFANMGRVTSEAGLFGNIAQREQMTAAISQMERLVAMTEKAAAAQRGLAASARQTAGAMVSQTRVATAAAGRVGASSRKGGHGVSIFPSENGLIGQAKGLAPLVAAIEVFEGTKKAVENAAELEQLRFRVRELSRGDPNEAPLADRLAAEVSARYPGITKAKALDTYIETRANSVDSQGLVDPVIARRNLMAASRAQNAAIALGFEMTPEDMQNLLKGVEGSGRAGDPKAISKITDAYVRAKQVFGTAIASSMIRDYVANAKSANFSIGDDQFYLANMVRMSEGNASRLGNEVNQTLSTLAGGSMKKGSALWLAELGLVNKADILPTGGGNVRIQGKGLKDSALMQTDQGTWAATTLLSAIEAKGILSDSKIEARMKMLRDQELKRNPNAEIDPHFLRERAEEGLIAAELSRSGMRTTVTDNLAHFIGNHRLIQRDIAAMQRASGVEAGDRLSENPVAAFTEVSNALSNFGAVLMSPAVTNAAGLLHSLAEGISAMSAALPGAFQQIKDAAASVGLFFKGDGSHIGGDPEMTIRQAYARQSDMHPIIHGERDMEAARAGALSRLSEGAHATQDVSVHGDATVNVPIQLTVTASSELLKVVEDARNAAKTATAQMALVPTQGGHTGTMNTDARPLGHGGIGSR